MGFLGVCLEVVGGGNLAISTHAYVASENVHFSKKAFLILPTYFAKNHCFLAKILPLLETIVCELRQRFFSPVFSFCNIKGYEYLSYLRLYISKTLSKNILPQVGCKLERQQWRQNILTWSNFFDVVLFLLASLVSGPGFIPISSVTLEL